MTNASRKKPAFDTTKHESCNGRTFYTLVRARTGNKGCAAKKPSKFERNRKHGVQGLYGASSVSYLLRFADEAGRLDAKKAASLGVPPGRMFGMEVGEYRGRSRKGW